jgi:hypothetical protein
MRKIDHITKDKFDNAIAFKSGNTKVEINENICLYLHNNLIAYRDSIFNGLYITNCGYFTNVTKDRLNSVLDSYGLYIYQNKFRWYITKDRHNKKSLDITDNISDFMSVEYILKELH